ncbi:fructose-1,6-bisphosphatase/inositol-1-monophosphatase [Abditibacteriota bacterium]|nr:fructose-1,6-bisphosphatase/inositol-1-monophosphatase [Abditibacteriota bacterium]
MNLQPYLDFTRELAAAATDVILPYYGQTECGLESKDDNSPVTLADRGAEEVMRAMIEKKFPDHGIVGEEYGPQNADAEWVWILDPIDGTKSFIASVPLFGTLIGLLHNGKPVVGCVNQPVLNQLLLGDNENTTLNGKRVCVRPTSDISQALLLTTDPLRPYKTHDGAAYDKLARQARTVRSWGDCYGYLLVCCGWADIMLDPIMASWDLLPILPCLAGAGAMFSTWDGQPIPDFVPSQASNKMYSCIAANPALHSQVVAVLNGRD